MNTQKIFEIFVFLVFIALVSFLLLFKMTLLPVMLWDESRNVMNAIGIMDRQEFLTMYYLDNIDLWNTKPPLLIWLQYL